MTNSVSVEFLTLADLARSARVSPRTLRRYAAAGLIPAFKRGAHWRVTSAALAELATLQALASARVLAEVSTHGGVAAPQRPRGGRVVSRTRSPGPSPSTCKKGKGKAASPQAGVAEPMRNQGVGEPGVDNG